METTGGSIEGYSRTPKKKKLIKPKRRMSKFITIAKTGRLMDRLDNDILSDLNIKVQHFLVSQMSHFLLTLRS